MGLIMMDVQTISHIMNSLESAIERERQTCRVQRVKSDILEILEDDDLNDDEKWEYLDALCAPLEIIEDVLTTAQMDAYHLWIYRNMK